MRVRCHLAWELVTVSTPVVLTWSVSLGRAYCPSLSFKGRVSWSQGGREHTICGRMTICLISQVLKEPASRHIASSTVRRSARSAVLTFCTVSAFSNFCFSLWIPCLCLTMSMARHSAGHCCGFCEGTTKVQAFFKSKVLAKALWLFLTGPSLKPSSLCLIYSVTLAIVTSVLDRAKFLNFNFLLCFICLAEIPIRKW